MNNNFTLTCRTEEECREDEKEDNTWYDIHIKFGYRVWDGDMQRVLQDRMEKQVEVITLALKNIGARIRTTGTKPHTNYDTDKVYVYSWIRASLPPEKLLKTLSNIRE